MVVFLMPFADQSPAKQDSGPYPHGDLLVEVKKLGKPEVADRFRILDARGWQKYTAGHVPGAVWVDQTTWSRKFDSGQDTGTWAKLIGGLGIDEDTRVVIYDDNSTKDAARIWWILRYWGVRDVRLLNGGWLAWQGSGGKIETEQPGIPARSPKLAADKHRLATKDQVMTNLKTSKVQIIDTRSEGEYCGVEKTAKRNGAIPGAVHLEWVEVIDSKSQRFKTADELTKLFRDKNIDLNRPAITHCQSGGRAAVMAFAMELMGAKQVSNYYKSWSEWGNADDTPIVKPKP
jgi:thiosulfate/3-mercaptopyruvate sulfurtransferase